VQAGAGAGAETSPHILLHGFTQQRLLCPLEVGSAPSWPLLLLGSILPSHAASRPARRRCMCCASNSGECVSTHECVETTSRAHVAKVQMGRQRVVFARLRLLDTCHGQPQHNSWLMLARPCLTTSSKASTTKSMAFCKREPTLSFPFLPDPDFFLPDFFLPIADEASRPLRHLLTRPPSTRVLP
jgi:hypothetical protein